MKAKITLTKAKKIWLITAAGLTGLGVLVMMIAVCIAGGKFDRFDTTDYVTNTHEIADAFQSISIDADTEDIVLLPATDGQCKVVCREQAKLTHAVSVVDGTLTVQPVDEREWYDHISLFSWGVEDAKITVYLPAGRYEALAIRNDTGDISVPADFTFASMDISTDTGDTESHASTTGDIRITADTGDITVEGLSAGSVRLAVSTGRVAVNGVTCGELSITVTTGKTAVTDVVCSDLTSAGGTGDLTATRVIAANRFSIERGTGSVKLDRCDAAELYVRTDTGDVTGALLSDKVFLVTTDTGDIDVPKSTTGGRCEITTDTGDVRMTVGESS